MKILILGVGGIGSKLVREIDNQYQLRQLGSDVEVTIADYDTVDVKNIREGQNFTKEELGENKAKALKKRYETIKEGIPFKLDGEYNENIHLSNADLIVLCVDNHKTRETIFEYCNQNKKDFIDLRADGRMGFAMTKAADLKTNLESLDLKDEKSGSCQKDNDRIKGIIQNTPTIIANIGVQMILNYVRGERGYFKKAIKI